MDRTLLKVGGLITTFGMLCSQASCDRRRDTPRSPAAPLAARSDDPSPRPNLPDDLPGKETPSPSRAHDAAQVRALLSQGKLSEAEGLVNNLLAERPTDPELLFLSANILASRRDWVRAARTLEGVPEDHPEAGLAALGQSGDWYALAGRLGVAEAKFVRLLQAQPDSPLIHRRLAELYGRQGLRFEAAKHLAKLAELGDITQYELCALAAWSEPFHDDRPMPWTAADVPLLHLAEARVLLANGDIVEADRVLSLAERDLPDLAALSAFRGRLLLERQDTAELARWAQQVSGSVRGYAEYWYAIGGWQRLESRHEAALAGFCECVKRDPTHRDAYAGMVLMLRTLNREKEAARVEARLNQLNEAYSLFLKIGADGKQTAEMQRLADLLDTLDRPWEAIAWRMISAASMPDAQTRLANLAESRKRLELEWKPAGPERLVCEIPYDASQFEDVSKLVDTRDIEPDDEPIINAFQGKFRFREVTDQMGFRFQFESGIESGNHDPQLHRSLGGGIAAFDYDRNGFSDLYCVQASGQPLRRRDDENLSSDELYSNSDGKRFFQVTIPAGLSERDFGTGVTASDLNQDGWADLIVANLGLNRIWLNQGDGTFQESNFGGQFSEQRDWTTSVACGDLDGDQLPEIVAVNYVAGDEPLERECFDNTGVRRCCSPTLFPAAEDRIYRNLGDGRFELITDWSIDRSSGNGLGVLLGSIDGEPGNDVFVANDMTPNHFWASRPLANAGRQLVEQSVVSGGAYGARSVAMAGMGIAAGDFDGNGLQDLMVTNFYHQPNSLYMQRNSGVFTESSAKEGIYDASYSMLGFGTQAVDFDNNQILDLVVVNGHIDDYRDRGIPYQMLPQVFRGMGNRFQLLPPAEVGRFFEQPALGRALLTCDVDLDGRTDLVASYLDRPAAVIRNESEVGNWIQWEFVGTESERDAIGVTMTVTTAGDAKVHAALNSGDGYLCRNESVVSVGLGMSTRADAVEIRWPSGRTQQFMQVPGNRRYLVIEGSDQLIERLGRGSASND